MTEFAESSVCGEEKISFNPISGHQGAICVFGAFFRPLMLQYNAGDNVNKFGSRLSDVSFHIFTENYYNIY